MFKIVDAVKHAFMSIPGSERNPHACHMIQGGRCRLATPKFGDAQIQDNPTPIPLQPVASCMTSSAAAILLLYADGCADDIVGMCGGNIVFSQVQQVRVCKAQHQKSFQHSAVQMMSHAFGSHLKAKVFKICGHAKAI